MRTLLAALVLPFALAACGGGQSSDPAPAPATSSAPAIAKVSDATICGLLVDAKAAPLERAIDVMKKDYVAGDEEEDRHLGTSHRRLRTIIPVPAATGNTGCLEAFYPRP